MMRRCPKVWHGFHRWRRVHMQLPDLLSPYEYKECVRCHSRRTTGYKANAGWATSRKT